MNVSRTKTLSLTILRPAATVYDYAADPENLPAWAPGLCRSIRRDGEHWTVETPGGAMSLRFTPRNDYGVLDHTVTTPEGHEVYVPMRVVANGEGSEVFFTLFRRPGMSQEQFETDIRQVSADLERLREAVEAP